MTRKRADGSTKEDSGAVSGCEPAMLSSLARLRGWALVAAIAVPVGLAAVLVVALRGSSGKGDGSGERKAAARLPALPKAWSADLARGSKPLPIDPLDSTPHGELRTWRAGDTLVMLGTRRVTAYDVETGERRWTLRPPSGTTRVCGASRAPNSAGLAGLVLASGGGCRIVALVDVRTGKIRWRRDLGRRWSHTANDADLYVGDRTVAVPLDYRGYRLLDLRTGRPVEATPEPFDTGWNGDVPRPDRRHAHGIPAPPGWQDTATDARAAGRLGR